MVGNVWEWTQDRAYGDQGAAADGSPRTSGHCYQRAVLGGSWHDNEDNIRSGMYQGYSFDAPQDILGFRVARTFSAGAEAVTAPQETR